MTTRAFRKPITCECGNPITHKSRYCEFCTPEVTARRSGKRLSLEQLAASERVWDELVEGPIQMERAS